MTSTHDGYEASYHRFPATSYSDGLRRDQPYPTLTRGLGSDQLDSF